MPNLALFKQMNRLANQGRWNFVTQRPRKLLFGAEAKEPYELYAKMSAKDSGFFARYAAGQELKLITRFVGFFVGVYALIESYNALVPEKHRYGYKYGIKQHFEEKHRHEAEHGNSHHH